MKHHIDVIQAAITGVKAPTPRTGLNTDWQMVDKHDVKTLQEHILRRAKGLEVEVVEQLKEVGRRLRSDDAPEAALDASCAHLEDPICKVLKEMLCNVADIDLLLHLRRLVVVSERLAKVCSSVSEIEGLYQFHRLSEVLAELEELE